MSLSKEDRISISKKVVSIPLEDKNADNSIAVLENSRSDFEKTDNGNKSIQNNFDSLINKYQIEISLLDGKKREEVTEENMVNSAKRIEGNFFFPNTPSNPPPSAPDGIWKNFVPLSKNIAIGKKYNETQDNTGNKIEQNIINDVKNKINGINSFVDVERSSGKKCETLDLGTCDPDNIGGTTEILCNIAGGTWTPMITDVISDSGVVSNLASLKSSIEEWKTFLLDEQSNIVTNDSDSEKQKENDKAIEDIDSVIKIIEDWNNYPDFDTLTELPEGCSDFYNNLNKDDFNPSKLRSYELDVIKNKAKDREDFIQIRKTQITDRLGSVDQDLESGNLIGGTGLYFKRFRLINQRLNLLSGSLSQKVGAEMGIEVQNKIKDSNQTGKDSYSEVMFVSLFKAASSGTGTIHIEDSSGFSVGDDVYLVGEKQEELEAKITNIDKTTLFLNIDVPKKYTKENMSRVYKLL